MVAKKTANPGERSAQDGGVGYKKPPKHARFKPGRSGNPAGRPRKKPTVAGIVQEVLGQQHDVFSDGVQRTTLAVMVLRSVKEADKSAWSFIYKLAKQSLSKRSERDQEPVEEERGGVFVLKGPIVYTKGKWSDFFETDSRGKG